MKTPEWIARNSFVPRASVSALIDAYAEWDGEVDTFVLAWDRYTAGLDAAGRDYGYSRLLRSSDHDRAAQALRINADQLPKGLDQQGFIAFLDSLSGTYQRQTDAARALICSLTEDGSFELHAA